MSEKINVNGPHGFEQNLKIDLLARIQNAENPYHILYALACSLEASSGEAGYARHILENIRSVYGFALGDETLLADELSDVKERLARMEKAAATADFTPDEQTRINFAIEQQKKNIVRLENLIEQAKITGAPPVMK